MYFKINGVDILPFIAENGINWTRNDVDSDNAGRTMDSTMHRARVAIKERIEVTLRSLDARDTKTILSLISPEFVTVDWDFDPMHGTIHKTMYSNNVPAMCATIYEGTAKWDNIKFPLIER